MKVCRAIMAAGVAAMVVTSAGAAEKWDFASGYAEGSAIVLNLRDFADSVKVATGGEIEIVIHTGGSLFPGNEIKRAIQTGQVPIGDRVLSAHANENAIFGFDSVPFLAPSFDESIKLWKAAKPVLAEYMEKQNLVLLFSVPWPAQGLYSKKKLDKFSDVAGMKIRSYSAAVSQLTELAKAQPVQIEYAEMSQALATGLVNGAVGSGATGVQKKVWEVLKYYYELNMWLPRNYVFMNKDVWYGLDKPTQNIIRGLSMMAEQAGTARQREVAGWYNSVMIKNGMEIVGGSEDLVNGFKNAAKVMRDQWTEKAGENGARILDAYAKMK